MTYAEWLRDELPKVLEGTEYWKDDADVEYVSGACHIQRTKQPLLKISAYDEWESISLYDNYISAKSAPIIAEACSLIQTIEAKRREML